MIRRHALVVGANAYPGEKLDNAVADATRVAETLRKRGFEVVTVLDPDRTALDAAISTFRGLAIRADLAIVYLAGHAVERHGAGYFLPVDFPFPPSAGRLRSSGFGLDELVAATDGAASRIVVLDACRSWPDDPGQGVLVSRDLDDMLQIERDWPDLLLAYATSATTAAADGLPGEGGPFAVSLCRHLLNHSLTVDECFRLTSQDVSADRRRQQPWTYSSLRRTLSFTDLPRFAAVHRIAIPNPEHLGVGAWTAPSFDGQRAIVGLGDAMVWEVDLRRFAKIGHSRGDRLMGAADLAGATLLAGSAGSIYVADDGDTPLLDLGAQDSFGMAAAPDGQRLIHYGAGVVTCLRACRDTLEVVASHDIGFDLYCCTFLPDGMALVGGYQGRILEVDPSNPARAPKQIAQVGQHANKLTATSDGERLFVVGQAGLAVELDRSGELIADLLPDRRLLTAAGIREALMNDADDDEIRDFIFEPQKVGWRRRTSLAQLLRRPAYDACALAPTSPTLAIGTQESTVILIDIRDLQIIQELDVGSGCSSMVAGLHFPSDRELIVVDGRGRVTFFGA